MMILSMPGEGEKCGRPLHLTTNCWQRPRAYTGIREKSALIREALKTLVEREAARRLARLGGSQPDLKPIPRRRPKPK